MACFELDREIERTGAVFARYADDTVIVCDDYGIANRLACVMLEHGIRAGTGINVQKSEGISQVAQPGLTELEKAKESFPFLGHQISINGIGPAKRTIRRLKRALSLIIYRNLLLYPKRGEFNVARVAHGGTDLDLVDLVDCINELRRYLYGPVPASYLEKALATQLPLRLSMSALTYYALVGNATDFAKLDGWLADVLSRSYNHRRGILDAMGISVPKIPKLALVNGTWYSSVIRNETALPSVVKSWRYARKCYMAFGAKLLPYDS